MFRAVALLILASVVSFPVFAGGAGSVQYSNPLPNSYLEVPVGVLNTITSQGYGGDAENGLIGGFGVGLFSTRLTATASGLTDPVTALYGGFGGVMRGLLVDFRLIQFMGDFRLGAGGLDWVTTAPGSSRPVHNAGFSVLGAVDAELGILLFPWFKVGAVGSLVAMATVGTGDGFVSKWYPEYGLRFSWGAFKD
ncbi:MAG: hypothetical protein WCG80_10080 [Spirochaetales bacterium]